MKVLKNKAKAKTNQNMVSVPEAKAEVVQAEPIEKAEPCVIFRDNVKIPSMDDHASMSESINGSLRITVNGYDEEENIHLNRNEDVDTFPNKMMKYACGHGISEVLDLMKNTDDRLVLTEVASVRDVIFQSASTKINQTVNLLMAQATKIIIDDIARYSADIAEKIRKDINENGSHMYATAIYASDISNDSSGAHSFGNIAGTMDACEENWDAIKRSLSMWIDSYIVKQYDHVMRAVVGAIYSSGSISIVDADALYSAVEEFASNTFKTYTQAIHEQIDQMVSDIIYSQIFAYPCVQFNRRSYYRTYGRGNAFDEF